jgi:hypothetical protein
MLPGRGVDHPNPSSVEVKEILNLYLYAPSGPSRTVKVKILLFFWRQMRGCAAVNRILSSFQSYFIFKATEKFTIHKMVHWHANLDRKNKCIMLGDK